MRASFGRKDVVVVVTERDNGLPFQVAKLVKIQTSCSIRSIC